MKTHVIIWFNNELVLKGDYQKEEACIGTKK
jgi:hypothetical protein